MQNAVETTVSILEKLVSFKSLSGQTNLDLISYVLDYLDGCGIQSELSHDETGLRANLFATIGPKADGGVALSGHTDVVPVDGQNWTLPAYELTRKDDRLFGRGSVDMKGFLACALAMVPSFQRAALQRPIHLALSFDEETGSIGAPILSRQIVDSGMKPAAVIVGEPTEMKVIAGHKGGYEMHTHFTGIAGHSSDPRRGVNAIHYAARFIVFLEKLSAEFAQNPPADSAFDPPQSTLNIGTIRGGAGRSIIAEDCALDWELRITPPDDGKETMKRINSFLTDVLLPEMQKNFPTADIVTTTESEYPGLAFDPGSTALSVVQQISGENTFTTVPFGTDAGCFYRDGLPTVVFGPGSIEQAHKPDEYIELSQIKACLKFLQKLGDWQSGPP